MMLKALLRRFKQKEQLSNGCFEQFIDFTVHRHSFSFLHFPDSLILGNYYLLNDFLSPTILAVCLLHYVTFCLSPCVVETLAYHSSAGATIALRSRLAFHYFSHYTFIPNTFVRCRVYIQCIVGALCNLLLNEESEMITTASSLV